MGATAPVADPLGEGLHAVGEKLCLATKGVCDTNTAPFDTVNSPSRGLLWTEPNALVLGQGGLSRLLMLLAVAVMGDCDCSNERCSVRACPPYAST